VDTVQRKCPNSDTTPLSQILEPHTIPYPISACVLEVKRELRERMTK